MWFVTESEDDLPLSSFTVLSSANQPSTINPADFAEDDLEKNMETTNALSFEEPGVHGISRKRCSNSKAWKRNVKTTARQKGMEFLNSKGKTVPAKTANISGNLFSPKCRLKCNEIAEQHREGLFHSFYNLDENGKNTYIFGCISAYKNTKNKKYISKKSQAIFTCILCDRRWH